MVAQTKICAGAFILSASCIIAPLPALGGDIAKGEELFVKNCASCHIGGSNLVNEKRTLKKDVWIKEAFKTLSRVMVGIKIWYFSRVEN